MNTIDFDDISENWVLCQNALCPKAVQCLRHQASLQAPPYLDRWKCLLTNALDEEPCKFFQSTEKVTMARGLNSIYQQVADKKMRSAIRLRLTSFFGSKGAYYRYKDGERTMNPLMQQQVRDIVHQYAPAAKVSFDETFEAYDFTVIQ